MKGFALIEIILVTSIVGLMTLLILNWPSSFILNQNSNYQNLAKQIASQKMEDLRLSSFANLANGQIQIQDPRLSSLPSGIGVVIIADCPAELCTNEEDVKHISITLSWQEKSTTQSTSFYSLIGKGGLK